MSTARTIPIWAEVQIPFSSAQELAGRTYAESPRNLVNMAGTVQRVPDPGNLSSSIAVDYHPCEIIQMRQIGETEAPKEKHQMPHPPILIGDLDAVLHLEGRSRTVRTLLTDVAIHEWFILNTPLSSHNPLMSMSDNALNKGQMKAYITAHLKPVKGHLYIKPHLDTDGDSGSTHDI